MVQYGSIGAVGGSRPLSMVQGPPMELSAPCIAKRDEIYSKITEKSSLFFEPLTV
jgi:hypothetical protein